MRGGREDKRDGGREKDMNERLTKVKNGGRDGGGKEAGSWGTTRVKDRRMKGVGVGADQKQGRE